MNKNIQLNINDETLLEYFLPQKDILIKLILNEINKSQKLIILDKIIYIRFKEKKAIIFFSSNDEINDIKIISYDDMLTDKFLDKLIENKEKLDTRLKNFASYEDIDILKEEISIGLYRNRIKFTYDENINAFIGYWKYIEISLILNLDFKFIDLI